MKKLLMVKNIVLALCLLGGAHMVSAQDTTKVKVIKPAPIKPGAVKYPAAQPAAAKPYQARPAATYPQTPATTPAATTQAPVNPYAETPVSTDKSLSGQYQYVMSKTYHYQQPMIAALWKNINDTLKLTRATLKDAQAKLAAQTQSVNSLQNDVKAKDQNLNDANAKRDEVSLLGIPLSKATYNLVMWGLVIGMAVVLLIVILRTAGAGREAKYRTKLFEEVTEEFQAYKTKANEKEKKLACELQTERNKVDELMGRG